MKIAVIGSGISGLSAALILNQKHEVHLFESAAHLGGHAHTVTVKNGSDVAAIDVGFLVYNTVTYPHLTRFLDYLGVETTESDMTLSIQAKNGLEWAGENLRTIFAQTNNIFNFSFLRMLIDILHFNKTAQSNLDLSRKNNWTLKQLVEFRGYSEAFQTLYLLPMTGSIWSMSYNNALNFPAHVFLTFCINHHLLQINGRPIWRTIKGGSVQYVNRVRDRLQHVHSSNEVTEIKKDKNYLIVKTAQSKYEFDKVILATHAPTSKRLLQNDFADLAQELERLKVTPNRVVLHQDQSVMPKNKICWSAWNVQAQNKADNQQEISLTYYINKLQPHAASKQNYFVTLNNQKTLNDQHGRFVFDHPQFDFDAIEVQNRLNEIQGRHNIFFAGAWTRYGFHEDGILSAVNIAKKLGVEPPWI